ncbi:response regulator [Vibrio sp. JC009]|uniref:response regulator n=1 Tax=Vibrio sp. JC009 TaxID=2912314 RepID=UPI0023B15947|nr:response regulator [Vibrio sp. JC009]WED24821.1 response regulator [Vibrio sp. JC009]
MNILICDDSALARKTLYRTVSTEISAKIFFGENGQEAVDILSTSDIDLMFLDLTMPVMDGFEVLSSLPVSDYNTQIVVVSADIQEEAKARCLSLGANAFIEKPYKIDQIQSVLAPFQHSSSEPEPSLPEADEAQFDIDATSKFKELTNIALGRGAAILSDRVGQFINLPIPTVGYFEASELKMIISDVLQRDSMHAVTQRFVGGGIHGESLVCMRGKNITELAAKLGLGGASISQSELVMNIASLLVSTYLNSLAHQLVRSFSLRQPILLDHNVCEYLTEHQIEQGAFTIEFTYFAEELDFECEMLLLLDPDSLEVIKSLMERL